MTDKKQPNSATYEQLKLISVRMNLTAPEVMALTDVQVAIYLSELGANMSKRPLNYNQNISNMLDTSAAIKAVAAQKQQEPATYESPAAEDAQVFYDEVARTVRAVQIGDIAAIGYYINRGYQQCNAAQFKYLLDALLAAKQAAHGKE